MNHEITVTQSGCPLEMEGTLKDGRPFYFRAGDGYWSFSVLPEGLDPREYTGANTHVVAEGADPNQQLSLNGEEDAWALVFTLCEVWSFEIDESPGWSADQ